MNTSVLTFLALVIALAVSPVMAVAEDAHSAAPVAAEQPAATAHEPTEDAATHEAEGMEALALAITPRVATGDLVFVSSCSHHQCLFTPR